MPPRLARLLAVVVAIALVVGAFALRGALSDDDEDTADPGTSTGREDDPQERDETIQLVCDEDLGEEVCEAVRAATGAEVEVLSAGDVIAQAAEQGDPGWDAWLTLDGVPGVADVARSQAELPPLTSTDPTPVASSRLALLTLPETPGGCADEIAVGTACVIEADVRQPVAVPASDTSVGILAIAAGATALQDGGYDIRDYQGTPEADALESFLDDSPGQAGASIEDQAGAMYVRGLASAVITIEGLADGSAATPQGRGRDLRTIPLGPEVVIGVALVGLSSQGEDAVATLEEGVTDQTVRDALIAAGWTGEAGPTTGLPSDPGLIYALREELG